MLDDHSLETEIEVGEGGMIVDHRRNVSKPDLLVGPVATRKEIIDQSIYKKQTNLNGKSKTGVSDTSPEYTSRFGFNFKKKLEKIKLTPWDDANQILGETL